jgi:hypothetical protein
MSFEFLKTDFQLLETSLQAPPPSFFRNQFLEVITRNQFYKNSIDPNRTLVDVVLPQPS